MVRIEVRLDSVLLRKGHDGFMRGRPEPVLLCVLHALERTPRFLAMARTGLSVAQPFPCSIAVDSVVMKARVANDARALGLLCLAFEEDGGEDVDAVATDLDDPDSWSLRASDSPLAAPFALSELTLANWAEPPAGLQVELMHRGAAIAERCTHDDWIGASVNVIDASRRRTDCSPRIVAVNGRNDWELRLAVNRR